MIAIDIIIIIVYLILFHTFTINYVLLMRANECEIIVRGKCITIYFPWFEGCETRLLYNSLSLKQCFLNLFPFFGCEASLSSLIPKNNVRNFK